MSPSPPLLACRGLWKSYAAPALQNVALTLRAGEVHALVGENGAGKTTLARLIAGLTPPDRGTMSLRGQPHAPTSRRDAADQGIRIVLQELNLVGTLTVAENIFLARLPRRLGVIDTARLHAAARPLMDRLGLDAEPDQPVRTLGIGQQQLVEIAAGLAQVGGGACRLLILDEPTAALAEAEVRRLFAQIRELRAAGVGILYISHRLEEIRHIADHITVLRDGQVVGTRPAAQVSLDAIVRMMVGRELGEAQPRAAPRPGPVTLRVQGLSCGERVRDVSFEVRAGEILGFAGLMGSGRTETLRAVFGADRRSAGTITVGEGKRPARIRSPSDAVRHGLALLTEDRKEQGVLLPLSVRVNITLARLRHVARAGQWLRPRRERAVAERLAGALGVRCHSVEQPVRTLSGGNQQKVVLARWMFRHCDVLLFDEPTRGIDVGAKLEIYRLLADLADRGKALCVASSDLLELFTLCDRIAVLSAGRLAATFRRGEWTEDRVMQAALSEYVAQGTEGRGR